MSVDAETLKAYGTKAEDYAEMMKVFEDDPLLTTFIGALQSGARVLDLGSGPGWAAARMAETGLVVDATDAVQEMVNMASRIEDSIFRLESRESNAWRCAPA